MSYVRSVPLSGTLGSATTGFTGAFDATGCTAIVVGIEIGEAAGDVNADSVTAITYAGVALTTLVAKTMANGSNSGAFYLFGLIGPATGSNNLVITTDLDASPKITVTIAGYDDVASFGNVASRSDANSANSSTLNLDCAPGRIGAGVAFHGSAITTQNQTQRGIVNNFDTTTALGCAIMIESDGVGASTPFSANSAASDKWGLAAVELVPVASPVSVAATPTSGPLSLTSTTATATLAGDCGQQFAVGDMIVVCISCDNNGTNGATSLTSVTDVKGHTYTLVQATFDPGAAAAGITVGVAWALITTAMLSSDDVTVNFSPNTAAKVAGVWRLRPAPGYTLSKIAHAFGAGSTTGSPTITTSSIASGDVVVGVLAAETNTGVVNPGDADTTNGTWSSTAISGAVANSGTSATSAALDIQVKRVTAAGAQTFNPSIASCDNIIGWVEFAATARPVYLRPERARMSVPVARRRAA